MMPGSDEYLLIASFLLPLPAISSLRDAGGIRGGSLGGVTFEAGMQTRTL